MNIYADAGKIITNKRYVKREQIEQEIINRTLGDVYGSISVVGMQRMGKSSIVKHLYESYHDQCLEKGILMFYMTLSDYTSLTHFYKSLAEAISDELEDCDIEINNRLQRIFEKIETVDDELLYNQITRLVKFLKRRMGYRLYIVLDEFDKSRTLFMNNSGFAQLRSLLYDDETGVTFVFVSRRMVSELEKQLNESSLSGTLGTPIYVTPYSSEELDCYYDIAEKYGYPLSNDDRTSLRMMTGGHPHWLDLLMYRLVDEGTHPNIEMLFDQYAGMFYNEFDRLNALLDEQSLLHPLMQLIFGPVYDCTLSQVKSLEDYAIIHYNANGQAISLSPRYEDYLQSKRKDIDFAPKWHQCERLLRQLLAYEYHNLYGDNWEEKVIANYNYGDVSGMIKEALKQKAQVIENNDYYQSTVNISFLDTATTGTLFKLYSLFNEAFFIDKLNMSKDDFITITDHLRFVRNKYAHNNEELLKPEVRERSSRYIDELIDHIHAYLHSQI